MPYVIIRRPDARYLAPATSDSAYVSDLQRALFFESLEQAMLSCGQNEIAVPLNRLVTFK